MKIDDIKIKVITEVLKNAIVLMTLTGNLNESADAT
jgi:hypothetical protein